MKKTEKEQKVMAEGALKIVKSHRCGEARQRSAVLSLAASAAFILGLSGCGETARVTPASSTGEVHSYYASYMGSHANHEITVDRSNNEFAAVDLMQGTFTGDGAGFLDLSENYLYSGNQGLTYQSPALTGAFLAEIPGVGAVGSLLSSATVGGPYSMAAADECPNFPTKVRFLYVTPPNSSPYDYFIPNSYGTVDISTQGATVTLDVNGYVVDMSSGIAPSTPTNLAGAAGCSQTPDGYLMSYPLSSEGGTGSGQYQYLSSIGKSQLLAGGIPLGWNVLGIAMPSSAIDQSSFAGANYFGLMYYPSSSAELPAGFGDFAGSSSSCSSLKTVLAAASFTPSANAIYGGEYASLGTSTASGSENCDIAVDLGAQDGTNNGYFPNATVYVAPGVINSGATAVSLSAIAVAGTADGHKAIFLTYYGGANQAKPLGIYLFQRD
jgi:hypothetical protein